jgi:hypothetical protein
VPIHCRKKRILKTVHKPDLKNRHHNFCQSPKCRTTKCRNSNLRHENGDITNWPILSALPNLTFQNMAFTQHCSGHLTPVWWLTLLKREHPMSLVYGPKMFLN